MLQGPGFYLTKTLIKEHNTDLGLLTDVYMAYAYLGPGEVKV